MGADPVGIFTFNAAMLYRARKAIYSERPTLLSRTLEFLHKEYGITYISFQDDLLQPTQMSLNMFYLSVLDFFIIVWYSFMIVS